MPAPSIVAQLLIGSPFWPVVAGGFSPLFWLVVAIVPGLAIAILVTTLIQRTEGSVSWRPGSTKLPGRGRAWLIAALLVIGGVVAIVLMASVVLRVYRL